MKSIMVLGANSSFAQQLNADADIWKRNLDVHFVSRSDFIGLRHTHVKYTVVPEYDICNLSSLLTPSTGVLYLSGNTDLNLCERNPEVSRYENYLAPLTFARQCAEIGCEFIWLNSASIFGETGLPTSTYAKHKLMLHSELQGLENITALLIHSTYSEYQKRMFVYTCFQKVRDALRNGNHQLTFLGSLASRRDLVHQRFMTKFLMERKWSGTNNTLEIKGGKELEMRKVLAKVCELLNSTIEDFEILDQANPDFVPNSFQTGAELNTITYNEYAFPYGLGSYE